MKNLVQKQKMRVAGLCLAIGLSAAVNAQTAVGSDVAKNDAKTNVAGNKAAVRVVDNKGTVKYLQANNGLTQIVNTTNDVTTTTWQLGGTLTADTYIDATGKVFALDGLGLVDVATLSASTDATDGSIHGAGTGFTLLVRDEGTGAVKKLKLGDLVSSGREKFAVAVGQVGASAQDFALTLPTGVQLTDISKVSVYRNGIKLLATDEYTVSTVGVVNVKPSVVVDEDWKFIEKDVIEVHWAK